MKKLMKNRREAGIDSQPIVRQLKGEPISSALLRNKLQTIKEKAEFFYDHELIGKCFPNQNTSEEEEKDFIRIHIAKEALDMAEIARDQEIAKRKADTENFLNNEQEAMEMEREIYEHNQTLSKAEPIINISEITTRDKQEDQIQIAEIDNDNNQMKEMFDGESCKTLDGKSMYNQICIKPKPASAALIQSLEQTTTAPLAIPQKTVNTGKDLNLLRKHFANKPLFEESNATKIECSQKHTFKKPIRPATKMIQQKFIGDSVEVKKNKIRELASDYERQRLAMNTRKINTDEYLTEEEILNEINSPEYDIPNVKGARYSPDPALSDSANIKLKRGWDRDNNAWLRSYFGKHVNSQKPFYHMDSRTPYTVQQNSEEIDDAINSLMPEFEKKVNLMNRQILLE